MLPQQALAPIQSTQPTGGTLQASTRSSGSTPPLLTASARRHIEYLSQGVRQRWFEPLICFKNIPPNSSIAGTAACHGIMKVAGMSADMVMSGRRHARAFYVATVIYANLAVSRAGRRQPLRLTTSHPKPGMAPTTTTTSKAYVTTAIRPRPRRKRQTRLQSVQMGGRYKPHTARLGSEPCMVG